MDYSMLSFGLSEQSLRLSRKNTGKNMQRLASGSTWILDLSIKLILKRDFLDPEIVTPRVSKD